MATVAHKSPLVLLQGGTIESEANETLIIIPLGYLSTYPSTPKPATGGIVADRDGYYEPVILALSILSGKWSILKWETGTYIRVPPGSQLMVESGIVFFLLLSINLQPFSPEKLALTAPHGNLVKHPGTTSKSEDKTSHELAEGSKGSVICERLH